MSAVSLPTPSLGKSLAHLRARLNRWELTHLRALAAEQATQIEDLQMRLQVAERCAEFWQESHQSLTDHLANDTSDARAIGLTVGGELLVVRTQVEGYAQGSGDAA